MSISSVNKVAKQAIKPTSEAGSQVSGAEAKAIVAEAKKGTVTSGERKVVADLFQTANLSAAAKTTLTDFLREGDISLGFLAEPGTALSGKTFTLKPGQSVVFEAEGNQINNMGSLTAAGLQIRQEWISGPNGMGGMVRDRYIVTMPVGQVSGTAHRVTSNPAYQSRNNPVYAFSFNVVAS